MADIAALMELLRELTDEERQRIFAEFCTYCGATDPTCQCWNDD